MNQLSLIQRLVLATLALLASCLSIIQIKVHADPAAPQIAISQFKMTSSNGQFFMLYNTTATTLDMSKFQLEYFNNFDIAKSTSSKFISLTGSLPAHSFYLVSDATTAVCYQAVVDAVSLGLSSTSGMIEVLSYAQSSPGGSIMPTLQDFVGWSKTAASGAQTLPSSVNAFLQRTPTDASNYPVIATPGSGSWQAVQPDVVNACKLTTVPAVGGSTTPIAQAGSLLPGIAPAATIINLTVDTDDLAPRNVGLMAPSITELLPNPAGTGNDGTDEYVEIYNGNDTSFDLTGYSLQSGLTSLHSVSFPDGATLAPKAFTVFYSKDMNASLSNTSGQVVLLDPSGASVSQSETYGTAKDGQAWALANGTWYWTSSPTPGSANIIVVAPTAAKKTSKAQTKRAATTAKKTSKATAVQKTPIQTASTTKPLDRVPIHPEVLALIASLALLYGAYEYRTDLGNKYHQLRRYLGARFSRRVAAARR